MPLTYLWSKVSGPGTVTFVDDTDPTTSVEVSEAGTYVLRLTVSDGQLFDADDVTITVSSIPLPGDPTYYYGDIGEYVLWTSAHVFRTDDLQASPPVWELIDTGITGTIWSGQYIHVNSTTIGMWLMTSTAIWWCANIRAVTPSWNEVLPIATVQAADVAPSSGVVEFKTMFPYWSEPGYLCVATGPDSLSESSYQHCYFWHTHDYGQNWTQIDATNLIRTQGGFTHCYYGASLFAMNIERAAPGTIWCIRYTPSIGGDVDVHVMISADLGHTWSFGAELIDTGFTSNHGSLLNPFPDAGDPSYAVSGDDAAGTGQVLQVSTDNWATKTDLDAPPGYSGISSVWRVNKRSFDDLHIVAWWYHTIEAQWHLMQTNDGGVTWSLLWDSGLAQGSIDNTPMGTVQAARHITPNGWPGAEIEDTTDPRLPEWWYNPLWADTDPDVPEFFRIGTRAFVSGHVLSDVNLDLKKASDALLMIPPANTKRVVLRASWMEGRRSEGTLGTSSVSVIFDPPSGIDYTSTNDYVADAPDANETIGQTFTAETTFDDYATEDWHVNKDNADSAYIAANLGNVMRFQFTMQATQAAGQWREAFSSWEAIVVEMEFDDSSIYTPNPGVGQWVLILADNTGAPTSNLVQLTLDNFVTLLDKTGNLIALGGAWPDGANDGFAMPKV